MPFLKVIFADGGYSGKFLEWVKTVKTGVDWKIQIIKRLDPGVFKLLPKRWIIERTFGWLAWQRRLARDYEGMNQTSEAMVKWAMVKIMLNRIEK